eukprot:3274222-Alexandrium_andersonii.AAC.1
MSASLVGSEMCIRDRPSARWPGIAPLHDGCRRPTARPRHPYRPAIRGSTCLLYTSDAADDM